MKKNKGYKQTKIGMIPEDWEINSLETLATIQTGVSKSENRIVNDPVKIPYLRVANVQDGYFDLSEIKTIIIEKSLVSRYLLIADDVLFTEGGDFDKLGRGAIWKNEIEKCIHQNHIFAVRVNKALLYPEFLNYYSSSQYGKKFFKSSSKQTTNLASINSTQLKSFPIPLPPLPEQKKIAVILSTWDEAIEKLESLLALKEKRKRGLMQSLLTGKKRLKGFYSNWIEYYLGDLFDERIEIGFNKLPLVSVTRDRGIVFRNMEDQKDTSSEDKSKYLHICPGDIGYNTMRMWQGVSGLSEIEGIVSPAYTILKPQKNVHGLFFQYLFKFPSMINYFYRHSQGLVSDTLNLKYSNFKKIKAFIPPLPEQKCIAEVLSAADNEINLHKDEIEKIKLQKKGLMQKLLTGQVRVNV